MVKQCSGRTSNPRSAGGGFPKRPQGRPAALSKSDSAKEKAEVEELGATSPMKVIPARTLQPTSHDEARAKAGELPQAKDSTTLLFPSGRETRGIQLVQMDR